jgi:hypothetical protein
MKRLYWMLGLGIAGLFIGLHAGSAIIGLVDGLGVGLGFGTIFSERRPTPLLILYWALTLAIAGPFFGVLVEAIPNPSSSRNRLILAGCLGAVVGGGLGAAVGLMQWRLRIPTARRPSNS